MEELIQWLLVQLDADTDRAQGVVDKYGSVWTADDTMESVSSDTGADVVAEPDTPRAYIALWDPARVLRGIEAKRAILALHTQSIRDGGCQVCDVPGGRRLRPGACTTVRMLATEYADRPGYREEWRP